jgi:MFS family permease
MLLSERTDSMNDLTPLLIVGAIIGGIIGGVFCGRGCGFLADEKGYERVPAFFAGLLFGIFGLILYAGLPDQTTRKILEELLKSKGILEELPKSRGILGEKSTQRSFLPTTSKERTAVNAVGISIVIFIVVMLVYASCHG